MAQSQLTLLSKIKEHFKLNIYEAKIWTALLGRGIASAAELAEISRVPRSRCYDVLETLEKKGFIIMKIGKPIKYIAVKPDVILERVKKDHEAEAKQQLELLDSISTEEAFRELELLHSSGIKHVDINDISKSIVGRGAINKQIKTLLKGAKERVLFVSDMHTLERNLKPLKSALPSLKKNMVSVEVYAPFDKRLSKKIQGANYRDYKTESSFLVIDSKEILFLVSSSGVVAEYEVAIWMQSSLFAGALTLLFEAANKKQ